MATPLTLFDKVTIGNITSPNRIMRSATWEGLAGPHGEMTPALASKMVGLVRGGVGIITFSHTFVSEGGRAGMNQLGLADDAVLASYGDLLGEMHKAGPSVVGIQLNHAGRLGVNEPRVGPSSVTLRKPNGVELYPCAEATLSDIDGYVARFCEAAVRAKKVGFDFVMIHCAHGYLLSEFLSPAFNTRTDMYGGSLENRARLALRVVKGVKAAVGADFPVAVKMNTSDFCERGLTVEESATVAVWLAQAGVCLIEASGGTPISAFSGIRIGKLATEAYHREGARAWKEALRKAGVGESTKVALVGGVRDPKVAAALVNDGTCDIVSMARPLIREPDLPAKWRADPDYVSKCTSCSKCHNVIRQLKGFECQANN